MIVNKVPQLLKQKGITMITLSRKAGISKTAVIKIYHNRTTQISMKVLNRICEYFECDVNDVFEYIKD